MFTFFTSIRLLHPELCPSKLPNIPKNFHIGKDGKTIFCVKTKTIVRNHTTIINSKPENPIIVNNPSVQQATTTNADTFVVVTCISDFNSGLINQDNSLAFLCDTAMALYHNEGLNSSIPQIDQYPITSS